jgi:hypothetical protein
MDKAAQKKIQIDITHPINTEENKNYTVVSTNMRKGLHHHNFVSILLVVLLCWALALADQTEEREERPNTPCNIEDLEDACPDPSVDGTALINECGSILAEGGQHEGLKAAECYMEYLCHHHNQEAVNQHKACIDIQCPLAKHLPVLQCEEFLVDKELIQGNTIMEVTKPPAGGSSNNNQKKKSGGMGAGGVIAILLVLAGVGFALYTFRDKIGLGRRSSQGQPPDLAPQTAGRQLD